MLLKHFNTKRSFFFFRRVRIEVHNRVNCLYLHITGHDTVGHVTCLASAVCKSTNVLNVHLPQRTVVIMGCCQTIY